MRVIVCGSRTWAHEDEVYRVLSGLERNGLTIIHGGARGADRMAHHWASQNEVKCEEYPADWNKHGRSAGPIRNRQMLDLGADMVIAFRSEGESRGTDDMIRETKRRRIDLRVVTRPRGRG